MNLPKNVKHEFPLWSVTEGKIYVLVHIRFDMKIYNNFGSTPAWIEHIQTIFHYSYSTRCCYKRLFRVQNFSHFAF